MRKTILRGKQKLRQLANWTDGLFGQALIVFLAVILAATAGASA